MDKPLVTLEKHDVVGGKGGGGSFAEYVCVPMDVARKPANLTFEEAAAVPLAALYSAGPDSYVFMRDGAEGHRPVTVKIGAVNDTHAQVVQGLKQGDQVLLLQAGQGRDLLEKAGIKVAPATRPSVVDDAPPIDRGPNGAAGASRGSGNGAVNETPTTNPTGAGRRKRGASGGTGGGTDQRPAATPSAS